MDLSTPEGVTVHLQPGTCMRTRRGRALTGNVILGIDDAGGASNQPTDPTLLGVVRVYTIVESPVADRHLQAFFEPPAEISLELGDSADLTGGFEVYRWSTDGPYTVGPDPLGNDPTDTGLEHFRGFVDVDANGIDRIPLTQTGPVGVAFSPSTKSLTQMVEVGDPKTYTIPLDADLDIAGLSIINPDNGQIYASESWPFGLGVGWEAGVGTSYGSTPPLFDVRVLEVNGMRVLEIRTDIQNELDLRIYHRNGSGDPPTWGDPQIERLGDDNPAETDLTGPYAGDIDITIIGCDEGGWDYFYYD
ncbi:MAG TPA: hypothetical protein ENK57_20085, partial [Polyangiaceae bacterium]|nr:hypothetical protein [Polyangiaceae bacterium]